MSIIGRNNVRVSGQGSPMLFAHGFGCDQNMWRYVAPAFSASHQVVLFDYVGCGNSDLSAYSPQRYGTLEGYAQDVLDVCAALELHDVIFVGHSVSAMIGLLAAIREPDRFSRLIFVSPSPSYINDSAGYVGGFERGDIEGLLALMDRNPLGWASFLAPLAMKNPERPELAGELEQSFCAIEPAIARRFAAVTFFSDNRPDLAKLGVPSLIVQCTDDALAPVAVGEYLHRHLPGSTLRLLEASGHCPHLSHPAQTVALIEEYLEPVSIAGSAIGGEH